ncbi:hypothetical protein ACVWWK_002857 [Bradyrhizobium sp. LB9.1b]
MSMKFDIQPASNPIPEKDRVAKLVDPGFREGLHRSHGGGSLQPGQGRLVRGAR